MPYPGRACLEYQGPCQSKIPLCPSKFLGQLFESQLAAPRLAKNCKNQEEVPQKWVKMGLVPVWELP